jgi:hypothetical protein
MSPTIFVLCGSLAEYNAFLLVSGIPEKHTRNVTAPRHLKGFGPHPRFEVVYYGHYWDNPLLDAHPEETAAFLEYLTEGWKPLPPTKQPNPQICKHKEP